jgi:TonB family protein
MASRARNEIRFHILGALAAALLFGAGTAVARQDAEKGVPGPPSIPVPHDPDAATPSEPEPSEPEVNIPPDQIATKVKILNRPRPKYPEEARRNRVAGTVKLRVLFGADGEVKRVRVVRGLPDGVSAAAVEAAKRFEFTPAVDIYGNTVDLWMPVEMLFKLQ